jgi:hypothetical protein
MNLPPDRRSDLFSDWLEAYVTGTSTPDHEVEADPILEDLCLAADRFHGLSERWAQEPTILSRSDSTWEDIMASHAASFPHPRGGIGGAGKRTSRWDAWNRFVSAALIVAVVIAIGAGAWRMADQRGSGPGSEPSTTGVAGLGQTPGEATPDASPAAAEVGPSTTPVEELPGIQSAALRSYGPMDQTSVIGDLVTISIFVYQFDSSADATTSYEVLVANQIAEFETSVQLNAGYSMHSEDLHTIGERAHLVRLNFAVNMGYQVQEYILTLHENYVFAVMTVTGGPLEDVTVTPPAIAEATAAATDLALALIANGQPSADEPRFYADGTSTGGNWGFMPEAGDPLLLGMQPMNDQQLYPTDSNAAVSEADLPPNAEDLTGIVAAVYRDYASAGLVESNGGFATGATPMTEAELSATRYSTITVFVYQLDTAKDAAVAYDQLSRGLLGSIADVNGGDGQEMLLSESTTGIGDQATRSRNTITSEGMGTINQTTFQSVTVQQGEFVFVISSRSSLGPVEALPVSTPDEPDPMLLLATQIATEGQISSDEPVFAVDGTSTGGLWDFMPAEGDPLLMGLAPLGDQVLYPVPER